jgi:hypothetical protein
MRHTKEQLETWIQARYAADYYRFEWIQEDFKVLSFHSDEKSLNVVYRFVSDESKLGNDSEGLVLFHFDEESWNGFFPNELQIVTIEEKYIWKTKKDCENLSDDFDIEDISHDIEWITWDDKKISDETVLQMAQSYDEDAIVETLVGKHSAATKMPEFVPERLKGYFQSLIDKYLKDN